MMLKKMKHGIFKKCLIVRMLRMYPLMRKKRNNQIIDRNYVNAEDGKSGIRCGSALFNKYKNKDICVDDKNLCLMLE